MSDKPNTIKVKEASADSMMKSNCANAGAKRKLDRSGNTCWAQTLLFINAERPLVDFSTDGDEDAIKEEVRKVYKKRFMDLVECGEIEIPENGTNARTGANLKGGVIDPKTDEPKWSSWDQTRTSISICGEVGRLIHKGVADALIISENEVLAKSDASKAVPSEPAIDTITKAVTLIRNKFADLSDKEQAVAITLIENLYADMVEPASVATGTDG